jgi:hypothetical protein
MSVAAAVADHTAEWLAFSGALAVAVIAAATAQWRLRVQLAHDRDLAERENLRQVFDEILAIQVDIKADEEEALRRVRQDGAHDFETWRSIVRGADGSTLALFRIGIRLPDRAVLDALEGVKSAHRAFGYLLDEIGKADPADHYDDDLEARIDAAGDDIDTAMGELCAAAYYLVGLAPVAKKLDRPHAPVSSS